MCQTNATAETGKGKGVDQNNELSTMEELNEALKACKFGKFHYRLLIGVLIRGIAGTLPNSSTTYLLITADCDLGMSLFQKGLLNSIPFLGMCVSMVVAGFLTDAFGRRKFVLIGLGGLYLMMTLSGFAQTYEMLLTSKFFEGVFTGMAHMPAVSLTAEFCHDEIRDRMLAFQFSFLSISQVAIAAMSWGLLMQDWKSSFFDGYIVLNTWNFYLIAMAQWGLISCTLYLFIPESPNFLLTQHKYGEVREILINIYKENTGKAADTYQFRDIWKDKTESTLPEEQKETVKKSAISTSSLIHNLVMGLHNVKPMFQKPLGIYLLMLCFMHFITMAVYYVVLLWFPQLSTVVEHYANSSEDLCGMLDSYTSDLRTSASNATTTECVQIKSSTKTYVDSIIIGSACFVPQFLNGLLVNRVGKKTLIIVTAFVSVGATLASRWAFSRVAVVALFSLNAAVLQGIISLFISSSVELFPTTTRTFATSISMMVGRVGSLVGNVLFPILLDLGCVVPFYTMTTLLVCVVIVSFLLPSMK